MFARPVILLVAALVLVSVPVASSEAETTSAAAETDTTWDTDPPTHPCRPHCYATAESPP